MSLAGQLFIAGRWRDAADRRTVGSFLAPTVLSGMTTDMRAMNEEPFGPVSLFMPFGLAARAFARPARTVAALGERIARGMIAINQLGLALAATPFGGMKDSGDGSEGGTEAIESCLSAKLITERPI